MASARATPLVLKGAAIVSTKKPTQNSALAFFVRPAPGIRCDPWGGTRAQRGVFVAPIKPAVPAIFLQTPGSKAQWLAMSHSARHFVYERIALFRFPAALTFFLFCGELHMPKSTLSILKPRAVTAPLTLRLPQSTVSDLQALQKRLKSEAPQLRFDVGEIVEAALREALDSARAELDRLKDSPPASR